MVWNIWIVAQGLPTPNLGPLTAWVNALAAQLQLLAFAIAAISLFAWAVCKFAVEPLGLGWFKMSIANNILIPVMVVAGSTWIINLFRGV